MKTHSILALMISPLLLTPNPIHSSEEIKTYFEKFNQNPTNVMEQLPEKTIISGHAIKSPFNKEDIIDNEFVLLKDDYRKNILSKSSQNNSDDILGPLSAIRSQDNPKQLIDLGNNTITNLFTLDRDVPRSSVLNTHSWSDTYWPLYSGASAWRYNDPDIRNTTHWKTHYDFAHDTKPVSSYSEADRKYLSPSEKYDLLVGDTQFTLTEKAWNSGKYYFDRDEKVETWMGLCHGWAPAAYMLDRPKQSVVVKDYQGNPLTFFPSDIKALGTLLWSNARYDYKFMGGRCNIKSPEKDENGRVTSQQCFDNNPGSFHIAVVNQIGKSKRSLIMDATFDYEVWNQPIHSYAIRYFDLNTQQTYQNLNDAIINLSDYTQDKFRQYRSSNTTKVVGVSMDIVYVSENQPSHRNVDSKERDSKVSVRYYYDLELNNEGEIIGGEWYTNHHPDFLWTPTPNAVAQSVYKASGNWQVGESIPSDWRDKAIGSSKYSEPLTSVVKELFKRSSTPSLEFKKLKVTENRCLDFYDIVKGYSNNVGAWYCLSPPNDEELLWSIDQRGQIQPKFNSNLCLTADTLAVGQKTTLAPCDLRPEQQWSVSDTRIISLKDQSLTLSKINSNWSIELE